MLPLTLDKLPRRLLARLDIETMFKVSRCVVAAERLRLFRRLDGGEWTAAEIGRRVGLHPRHRDTFLDILAALGLLVRKARRYRLSPLARRHFISGRGPHWTRLWSRYCADDYTALSVLERSLTTGRDYRRILGIRREAEYDALRHDRKWAEDFTRMMHDTKRRVSGQLARHLDLSGRTALLDVGGGSGVMSMALVRRYPDLKACVQDFEPVCREARKIIRAEGLSKRVKTRAADMCREIPSGYDVVMYWDLGAVPERSLKLAYRAMPEGGLLVIGGALSGRENRSINHLARRLTLFYPEHFSWQRTVANIRAAGFTHVRRRRVTDGTWVITAHK